MAQPTIVIGTDGSHGSRRAMAWSAEHASKLEADIIVVHAIELVPYLTIWMPEMSAPPLTPAQSNELHEGIASDWCKPLTHAGVPFRVEIREGRPSKCIREVAAEREASCIVVGRRGLGGFTELLLGSTSHELVHHADRPLVLVP